MKTHITILIAATLLACSPPPETAWDRVFSESKSAPAIANQLEFHHAVGKYYLTYWDELGCLIIRQYTNKDKAYDALLKHLGLVVDRDVLNQASHVPSFRKSIIYNAGSEEMGELVDVEIRFLGRNVTLTYRGGTEKYKFIDPRYGHIFVAGTLLELED